MICHQHKCLFVHIPKVAGQSIESIFVERAGLTWQQREHLLLKPNSDPKLGPPRLAHLTAQEYISCGHISSEQFEQYFKFTFVRNPWARIVSEYNYRKLHGDKHCQSDFKTFLFKRFPKVGDDNYQTHKDYYRHVMPQSQFLFDEAGNQLVDFIGKFENLQNDFNKVCQQLNIGNIQIPHKNKSKAIGFKQRFKQQLKLQVMQKLSFVSKGTKPSHYSEYFDDESHEFIADYYAEDIHNFGYVFEPKPYEAS